MANIRRGESAFTRSMKDSDRMHQRWPRIAAFTRGRYFPVLKKVFHDLSLLFFLVSASVFVNAVCSKEETGHRYVEFYFSLLLGLSIYALMLTNSRSPVMNFLRAINILLVGLVSSVLFFFVMLYVIGSLRSRNLYHILVLITVGVILQVVIHWCEKRRIGQQSLGKEGLFGFGPLFETRKRIVHDLSLVVGATVASLLVITFLRAGVTKTDSFFGACTALLCLSIYGVILTNAESTYQSPVRGWIISYVGTIVFAFALAGGGVATVNYSLHPENVLGCMAVCALMMFLQNAEYLSEDWFRGRASLTNEEMEELDPSPDIVRENPSEQRAYEIAWYEAMYACNCAWEEGLEKEIESCGNLIRGLLEGSDSEIAIDSKKIHNDSYYERMRQLAYDGENLRSDGKHAVKLRRQLLRYVSHLGTLRGLKQRTERIRVVLLQGSGGAVQGSGHTTGSGTPY